MGDERPSVVLVEDHPMVRQSLRSAIETDGRLEFVGDAPDGQAGIDLIRASRPDVASVDLVMKGLDGWDLLEAVITEELETRVVFLSGHGDGAVVHRALQSGAAGFVSKGTEGPDYCELLLRAAAGKRAVSADLQELLVSRLGQEVDGYGLSARELQILQCLAEGKNAEEIGAILHLSPNTVRTHTQALKSKLGTSKTAAAVARGFRLGLIS